MWKKVRSCEQVAWPRVERGLFSCNFFMAAREPTASGSPVLSDAATDEQVEIHRLPPSELDVASPHRVSNIALLPSNAAGGASFISSVLNLANTIMGSGLLTLPSAFAGSGLLAGLCMAIVAGILNVVTLHCITAAAQMVPGVTSSFGSLAEAAFPGFGGVLVDAIVALFGLGVCIGYLIVSTDVAVDVTGVDVRPLWTLLAMVLVAPLTMLKSMDSLRFTSSFAIAALLLTAVFIVAFSMLPSSTACQGFTTHTVTCNGAAHAAQPLSCPGTITYGVGAPMPSARALSKFVLAFGCQQNMFPILAELRRPTPLRTLGVSTCAIGMALVVYLAVATAGYLTFGERVCSNVLNTYPRSPLTAAVRLGLAGVVITSYPLLAFEARRAILAGARACSRRLRCGTLDAGTLDARPTGDSSSSSSNRRRARASSGAGEGLHALSRHFISTRGELVIACTFVLATTAVALSVSDLGVVLGLVGASCGMLISFTVPCACYVVLSSGRGGWIRPLAMAILAASVVLLPLCVAVELIPT